MAICTWMVTETFGGAATSTSDEVSGPGEVLAGEGGAVLRPDHPAVAAIGRPVAAVSAVGLRLPCTVTVLTGTPALPPIEEDARARRERVRDAVLGTTARSAGASTLVPGATAPGGGRR
ncbi:hypothetical protein PHK61_14430 [Actinomycetospora lutea]|uniref:hypothetical protein n=1 Tax=Actinomycetospora lutea TaxID=663604 RepID=UPI002366145A|nr:hypothetical protein [Actinomycetospora lutea]MDD7939617.1 hypothetical protein [Actinomycetospora lutea]